MTSLLLAAALFTTPPGLDIAEKTAVVVRANVTETDLTDNPDPTVHLNNLAICSGFVAYSQGTHETIVTARHCTQSETKTFLGDPIERIDLSISQVQFFDGDVGRIVATHSDPADDVAILDVVSQRPHPYAFLDEEVQRAQPLFAFGMPQGKYWSYSSAFLMQGEVYAGESNPWQQTYLLDCPSCSTGSSGGPVFDTAGRVIGTVVAGNDHATIVVPADRLRLYLESFR